MIRPNFSSFTNELVKIAKFDPGTALLTAALLGLPVAAVGAGLYVGLGKKKRGRIRTETRDPRLYSNIRGMLTFKSREERIARHKRLGRGEGTTRSALRVGLGGKW